MSTTLLYFGLNAINTNEGQQTQVRGIMAIVLILTLLNGLADIQDEAQDHNLYFIALR